MSLVRTHLCSHVSNKQLEQQVIVNGWVNVRRDHGGVIFIDLRDYSGTVQIVFDFENDKENHKLAESLRNEFVIGVKGVVIKRTEININPKLVNGDIEVKASQLVVYNSCDPLPFQINEDAELSEKIRLEYRYLDLRRTNITQNFLLRSKANRIIRDFLSADSFHEIETPVLTKSTPEGARDYLVPSRVNPNKFYALPQSPQIFKQLLMISGMDRYFQIVRCFRDEDLRGNRQPEFTQIDMELSFTSPEEVMLICDRMMNLLFKETVGIKVETPIEKISYQDAIDFYGSDAPDMRYDLKLTDISEIFSNGSGLKVFDKAVENGGVVKALLVPEGGEFSRKDLDDLTQLAMTYGAKGMAWVKINENGWQSPIEKFLSDEIKNKVQEKVGAGVGDLILFGADSKKIVSDSLGNVRKDVARRKNLIDDDVFKFVWVTDFPLFEKDAEDNLTSSHHPFTKPIQEDLEKWSESNPTKIKAEAYDLVLNGVEIGGGSMRIHNPETQTEIFNLLGLSDDEIQEKFGFLIDAMRFGAPPHGGIAFGMDRIMMFLCKTNSIRDVIAFPKTQNAACLMTNAPSTVSSKQLRELKISLIENT